MAKKPNGKKEKDPQTDKEVVVAPDLTPDVARGLFDTRENLKGLEPRLPQIKILHAGALMFVMPDGTRVQKFESTMLDFNRCNAYWSVPFTESGGGTPPDCASLDAINLDPMSEAPQSATGKCKQCPMNQFGSEKAKGEESRGKACKNMMRVHLLISGQLIPFRMTLPPTSLKVMDEYIPMIESRGHPYQLTVTEFSLVEAANKDGIKYSRLALKDIGKVTSQKEAFAIKNFIDEWKSVMRGQEIAADEVE
jgi:hypothetical protein